MVGTGRDRQLLVHQSETEISGGDFYGENLPLPGLSENVWSATVFFDYERFATHVNIRARDEFVQSLPVPGASSPVLAQAYTTIDAQASYAFDNGFSVVFAANNVTDEENVIEYGVRERIRRVQAVRAPVLLRLQLPVLKRATGLTSSCDKRKTGIDSKAVRGAELFGRLFFGSLGVSTG